MLTAFSTIRRGTAVLLLAGALSGCVAPAPSSAAFRSKALASVQAAISEVQSTRLLTQAAADGRAFGPYADRTVSASEDALNSVAAGFGLVQPPTSTDDVVRDRTLRVLGAAFDAVSSARIAVRRDDKQQMAAALVDLQEVARDLDRLQREL